MADHHADHHGDDHHDEHAVHQAPWVTILTIAVCFGVTFFLLALTTLL